MPKSYFPSTEPDEVIKILLDGNKRFLAKKPSASVPTEEEMIALSQSQSPIAAIICCADSRVSPEIICDQPLGKLFINRNAGNVVNNDVLASLEIAAFKFSIPLVVVMGHKGCSAVTASLTKMSPKYGLFNNMVKLGKKIFRSNVFFYKKESGDRAGGHTDDLDEAIVYNVRYGVQRIGRSKYLSSLIERGRIRVVPAVYDIFTGKLEFLE